MNASEAHKLPAPKGFTCAAGCGHDVFVHREAGCDASRGGAICDCSAPYGRILPVEPETPLSVPFFLTEDQLCAVRELLALVHYDDLADSWLKLLPVEFHPQARSGWDGAS